MAAEIKFCPNCGKSDIHAGNGKIICFHCNTAFKIEADGSAKVIDTDPLEKISKRVLEDVRRELKQPAPANHVTDPPVADLDEPGDDDDEDGFITFGKDEDDE